MGALAADPHAVGADEALPGPVAGEAPPPPRPVGPVEQENQAAVFFRDGKALDTFGPGRHTLTTMNIPLLTRLLSIPFGGKSPFQAGVVFVARHTFQDLKWGTKEPIAFRDSELRMVRLRAFGKYSLRVSDPQLFVGSVVGTRGIVSTEAVGSFLRDIIVARLNDLLGENLKTIFDLPGLLRRAGGGRQIPGCGRLHQAGA